MRTFLVGCALLLAMTSACATDSKPVELSIADNGFSPATLQIPAGQRVELKIHNTRSFPSEFESYSLNSEKVIPGGTTLSLWVGPLKPGTYKFFDDFNPGAKKGKIVVGADKSS